MKKILISDKLADAGINFLNEQEGIQVHIETGMTPEQLCATIADYDALLIRSDTKVTDEVLQAAKNLKLVGRAGIGVDNVDIPAATEQGVIVMNTPDANATTTAELALAHMFSLSRNLPKADKSIREGKWERSQLVGAEISNKTLAILGFGTIGRIVAKRAAGLNMRVIAYDPFVAPDIFAECGAERVDLDVLVKQADYLTLHCPLLEQTRGVIGAEQLAAMKNTAMIINCARGGLIDETALYHALKNGEIAGAALDVYENEPPKDSPLLELDNIVFTPHLGASTREAQVAVSVEIARQAVTFLKTGEAVNALNLPRLSADDLRKSQPYMEIATSLGKVLAGLATQPIERVKVSLLGKAADAEARSVSTAALVGLLESHVSTPVNSVNAENIAKRQGISLTESKTDKISGYLALVEVKIYCGDEEISLAGTLLGDKHPRIVYINGYEIEVIPEGVLLVTKHIDKPGVIAAISTVLGHANINILRMQVGIADEEGNAIAVISVSEKIEAALLQELCELAAVESAIQIEL
ncbi:MAG: phosphoglycerate dehydrogenase [Methyloprofundus sp.]|nr:phosphoglycerate dehydrogenase [Methyloprofundus sp.]